MVTGRRLVLLACLLFSALSSAATLTATVDKKEILAGEYVVLTLSLVNSDTRLRAEGISPNVDLTLLTRDFELGVPRENHSFNISRDRGRSTSDLTVELFPKKAGKFVIPSFTVDGISSNPVHIQVYKGAADATPEVFARGGISKSQVWQREQTIAYLDLYHRIELKSARLGGDIDIEPVQLELHKLTESQRKEQVAGITYNVERTAWAITPLLSQSYKIYLPDIWIETSTNHKLRLPFEEQHIEVKALPDNVPPLAMVGKPVISQTGFAETPRVDHVLPWEITLRAPVSPTAFPDQLPGLNLSDNIKVYSDAVERDIDQQSAPIMGIAHYHTYLIPLSAGEFTLPEIRIPYFDPERGAMDVAALESQTITVEPVPPIATSAMPDLPATARVITTHPGSPNSLFRWQLLSIAGMTLWLMTLAMWLYSRRKPSDSKSIPKPNLTRNEERPLQAILLDAFGSRTLEEGLNKWVEIYGHNPEIQNTVRAVQRLYYGRDKSLQESNVSDAVKKIVKIIKDTSMPGTSHDPWSPRSFTPHFNFIDDKR